MSLSISWLAAVPAVSVAKQTVNLTASSLNHTFGDWLHPQPPAANGPSVGSGPLKPKSDADSLAEIQNHLAGVAGELERNLGLGQSPRSSDIELIIAGEGEPKVNAPQEIRTGLQDYLRTHPQLVDRLNELSRRIASQKPLALLPASTRSVDPYRLTLLKSSSGRPS